MSKIRAGHRHRLSEAKAAGSHRTRVRNAAPSQGRPIGAGVDDGPSLVRWTQRLVVVAVGLFVAVQPIGAEDLWWHLARGRAAWQGSLTPTASLLVLETRAEADWLGGLPLYALYQLFGSTGWMLCRLVLVGLFLFIAVDSLRSRRLLTLPSLLLVALVFVALAKSFDPVPRLFDLLGIFFSAWWCWPAFCQSVLYRRERQLAMVPSLVTVAAAFGVWANLGSAVAAGVGLLLLAAICETVAGRKTMRLRWLACAVAVAAGSLNPRGWFGWTDSLVSLVPNWATPRSALEGTVWEALPTAAWAFPEWIFFALTLLWIANRWWLDRRRSPRHRSARAPVARGEEKSATGSSQIGETAPVAGGGEKESPGKSDANMRDASAGVGVEGVRRPSWLFLLELLPFAVVQWLAWNAVQNVPLAIVWLAADLAFQWRAVGWWAVAEGVLQSRPLRSYALILAALGLVAVVLPVSGLTRSAGWGVAASLDHRLMKIALEKTRPYGTALADDVRSGGMLAWLLPELPPPSRAENHAPLRLQDIASQAVTGGRFVQHRQLLEDLRRGRLMRYWRDDGSPGGYWLPLTERETTLLCVSNRHLKLIRGLEPSIWKPLSLDSPVIPYAPAGDPAYLQRLIEILRNRETVEYGAWHYELPVSSGSPFDRDWFGLRPVIADPPQILRQGQVFRAMNLHYAALRVLFVGRREFPERESLTAAVVRCQLELADQELIDAGKASWFRFWASRYNVTNSALPTFVEPHQRGQVFGEGQDADRSSAANAAAVGRLKPRLEAYFRQGPIALLTGDWAGAHPQLQYAVLCAAIEAGQFERADRLIAALRKEPVEDALLALVQQRERELHPPSDLGEGE